MIRAAQFVKKKSNIFSAELQYKKAPGYLCYSHIDTVYNHLANILYIFCDYIISM